MQLTYYTVYLRSTDEIVAHGNSVECAKKMGKSINGFHSMVSKSRKEIQNKYIVLIDANKGSNEDAFVIDN